MDDVWFLFRRHFHFFGIRPTDPACEEHAFKESVMKVKTNVRAGQGGSTSTSVDTSTSTGGTGGGGTNSGGVNSNKVNNTVVYYVPPVSRCVGI